MPSLQVKDFPEELYTSLRDCAIQQDRSISQQTVHVLREYIKRYEHLKCDDASIFASEQPPIGNTPPEDEREERIERRKALFAEADRLPKYELPEGFPAASEMIRQMRDERDEHIYELRSDK